MFMGQRCLHLLFAAVTWVKRGGNSKGAPQEEMICHILVDIYWMLQRLNNNKKKDEKENDLHRDKG